MLVLVAMLQIDGLRGFGGGPQPPEAKPDDFRPLKRSHILISNINKSLIMSLVTGYYFSKHRVKKVTVGGVPANYLIT